MISYKNIRIASTVTAALLSFAVSSYSLASFFTNDRERHATTSRISSQPSDQSNQSTINRRNLADARSLECFAGITYGLCVGLGVGAGVNYGLKRVGRE